MHFNPSSSSSSFTHKLHTQTYVDWPLRCIDQILVVSSHTSTLDWLLTGHYQCCVLTANGNVWLVSCHHHQWHHCLMIGQLSSSSMTSLSDKSLATRSSDEFSADASNDSLRWLNLTTKHIVRRPLSVHSIHITICINISIINISITQPQDWHSFYHLTEGTRLS